MIQSPFYVSITIAWQISLLSLGPISTKSCLVVRALYPSNMLRQRTLQEYWQITIKNKKRSSFEELVMNSHGPFENFADFLMVSDLVALSRTNKIMHQSVSLRLQHWKCENEFCSGGEPQNSLFQGRGIPFQCDSCCTRSQRYCSGCKHVCETCETASCWICDNLKDCYFCDNVYHYACKYHSQPASALTACANSNHYRFCYSPQAKASHQHANFANVIPAKIVTNRILCVTSAPGQSATIAHIRSLTNVLIKRFVQIV